MQRRIGTLVLVVAIGSVLAGCWAQPGSDAERSGFSPLDHGITPANVSQLHLAWTKALPGPVQEPMVTNAGVFATSGAYPSAGVVTSLARGTGATQWSTSLFAADSGYSAGPPVILDNKVYAPTNGLSPILGHPIDVFDAGTGAALPSAGSGGDEFASRGRLLVGVAFAGGSTGPVADLVYVNDLSGTASWTSLLDVGGAGSALPPVSSAAVSTTRLFIGHGTAVQSWALAPPTNCETPTPGATFCPPGWSTNLATSLPAGAHPVLSPDDGTVFAAAGASLVALSAATGAQTWSGTLGAAASAAPAVGNGFVYVPTATGELDVFALGGCGHATCAPLWHATTTSSIDRAPAVVPGGLVYTASANGSLHAFPSAGCGAATCSSLWSVSTGSTITGGPVPALGNLYVGTSDGRLIAYTL